MRKSRMHKRYEKVFKRQGCEPGLVGRPNKHHHHWTSKPLWSKLKKGTAEGERCNRGCRGVIAKVDDSGCICSAIINPPCSYCEDNYYYCPECKWNIDGDEEVAS